MTFRVNSVYSSGAWGGSSSPYGYNSQQRSLSNDFGSVFGANSSYGYNDSMSFMPAPQGAADFKMPVPQNAANFKMPVPAGANIPGFTNPLTVNPFGRNRNCHNSNNPFQNHHGGAANMRYSSSRTSFGSLTSGNKLSSMNIHTPSVDYNSTTAKTPFGSLTKTNIQNTFWQLNQNKYFRRHRQLQKEYNTC